MSFIEITQDYIDNKGNYWKSAVYPKYLVTETVLNHGKQFYKEIEEIPEVTIPEKSESVNEAEDYKIIPEVKSRKKYTPPKNQFQDLTVKDEGHIQINPI
jgi:hypothetical protein